MTDEKIKPLNWTPDPDVGFNVARRPDGGMHITIQEVSHRTLELWRKFSLEHLYDSDRLTTNLYDLSELKSLPEEAIQYAVEVNNDPAARNIRLAAVAQNETVREALRKIAGLSAGGGVEMGLFWTVEEAEAWLSRPLTLLA